MIEINNLEFSYLSQGPPQVKIPHLAVHKNETIFLHGPSGCGKTTLLELISGILTPNSGTISLDGKDLTHWSQTQKDHFRGERMGLIFQQFNLIPFLTAEENIRLPCQLNPARAQRLSPQELESDFKGITDALGISNLMESKPTQLSVGQQQRVAAARALLGRPDLILADEPTSALDADHRQKFIDILLSSAKRFNSSVIFVSHDQSLKTFFDTTISYLELNTSRQEIR